MKVAGNAILGPTTSNTAQSLIGELGRKYLWWRPVDGEPFAEGRIVSQIMNLGTYDDILQLEAALGARISSTLCCTPSRVGSAIAPGSSGAGGCPLRQVQRCRKMRPEGHSMPERFEPKLSIRPAAQREVWPLLAPALRLQFVLYGGTAVLLSHCITSALISRG
jgi:hypothetical protein